ncbi:DUF6907 domain-containing protein [Microbacterium marinilacus]|uniref:Uncharacterized protein n=1 Tax=Microbacterium marinilacus TaxID=415209 RepID=A0ABP7BQ55_9MICO|nr:hypothetical protein [Microbacterium marinilacus]MBY0688840.1 hypothetical protein [Microbacterium marinilacus]
MSNEHPERLTEHCPAWCDGQHDEQRLLEDQRHHSEYEIAAVIQHRQRIPGADTAPDEVEADELNIVAYRDVDARETWVVIANDRQHVEVTAESAARVHVALGQLLKRITAPTGTVP